MARAQSSYPPVDASLVNVLNPTSFRALQAALEDIGPIGLFVDAGLNVFEPPKYAGDINQLVLKVLHRLRVLVPDGVLVYTLHDRKRGSSIFLSDDENDPDAFAGPGAWERHASTSFRMLRGKDQQLRLLVRKTRFKGPGFRELDLTMTDQGFFEVSLDHKSMLAVWPRCIPEAERQALLELVQSKNDVYRDISKRTGVDLGTVKKYAQRNGPYKWEALLSGGS